MATKRAKKKATKKKMANAGKRNHDLSQLRAELQPLVEKANSLVRYIANIPGAVSVGLQEAMSSLNKRGRQHYADTATDDIVGELFDVQGIHDFRDMRREAARLGNFLTSDAGSEQSINNQRQREANDRLAGAFRNSNFHEGGTIDERLDRDVAKIAFEVYRRLEEYGGAALTYKSGGYGSENLINLIYAEIEDAPEGWWTEEAQERAIQTGFSVLEDQRAKMKFTGYFNYETGDEDTGIISKVRNAKKYTDIDW